MMRRTDQEICKDDAANNRKWQEKLKPRAYDSNSSDFLVEMVHQAIQPEAPSHMIIAICQYVAEIK